MKRVYRCDDCYGRIQDLPCIQEVHYEGVCDHDAPVTCSMPSGGIASWHLVDAELPAAPSIGDTVSIEAGEKPVTVKQAKEREATSVDGGYIVTRGPLLLPDEEPARRLVLSILREHGLINDALPDDRPPAAE